MTVRSIVAAHGRRPQLSLAVAAPTPVPLWARRLVLIAFGSMLALASTLAICGAVAQAEPPKLVSYGSFGAHEGRAAGVAVEGTGDLFVSSLLETNFGPSPVMKFDPSGKLLSPPSPFGSGHYSGLAVSPANGDVYVLGEEGFFTPAKIFVYDPKTGALVSSFEVSASHNLLGVFTDVQIAADLAGDVYVPVVPENKVVEYSPSGTLLKTFTGLGAGALKEPTGVAIDSSSDLWVAEFGDNRIVKLDSTGSPVEVNGKPVEVESEGVWSLALDGHGDVFATVENRADPCGEQESPCVHLVEYDSDGRQLADVGAGHFGEAGATEQRFTSTVAVNKVNGRVYVTDGHKDVVWVFGEPTVPVVTRELTAEAGASEAKLGALVDPGGVAASYSFEYGTTDEYGSTTPFPAGSVGEGVTGRAVWAAASGLVPGTTYHYRVVASNELGTTYGLDQTFTTQTAEQAACPNEQLRGSFSARLPDCRAYELVTPPVETSSQFNTPLEIAYASTVAADGEAVTIHGREPQPEATTAGEQYVAMRGAGGWVAEDIMPIESYDGVDCVYYQPVYAYSDQLTKEVMQADGGSRASASANSHQDPQSCNPEGWQIVGGEPVGYENLLVRDNPTGAYQLVNVTPPGVTPADAHFQAASTDLSHVIFTETSPLAERAQYGVENLYEWNEGALRLVSVLPDGTTAPGSLAAKAGEPEHQGVLSSDGSHVLFTSDGALYDRIDGQRTVRVDETQGGTGPSGGGSFRAATADGSKVFFLDESKLTAQSTAAVGEPDLYECAVPQGASKCELADLTVAKAGEHADVLRVTPLGRHDSSYVYFVAKGVLASNTREFTNGEGKTVVERAEAGKENLYLWNGQDTRFIAGDVYYGGRFGDEQTSPDGKWLSFESEKGLTGYEYLQPATGFTVKELFLYSAATGQLACASCNPTGESPGQEGGVRPRPETEEEIAGVFRSRRVLTNAGRAFFETKDALVPSDTNGRFDVYEYEGGHVYLISSGTSSDESNLEGASESGDDVFFRSNQQLVPQDTQEGMIVIYDARVAGGFRAPASVPLCATADACRAPVSPQPSIYGAPSSQTFAGIGNATPEAATKATRKHKNKKARKLSCKRRGRHGRCPRRGGARAKVKSHKGGKQ